jgi:long-subunit acyl-CoA synthetase (AMP-forming)
MDTGLGMKILDVYGMTETTGAFTANTPAGFRLGTVGRPYAGMEVTIAGDGEILARGPLTTPGYLNRPDLTADLIDASDPQVLAEVSAGVAAANERLARVQQVKRWHLLPVEWTAETEELTPTLKLKRRVVHAKYADVIDSLYAG